MEDAVLDDLLRSDDILSQQVYVTLKLEKSPVIIEPLKGLFIYGHLVLKKPENTSRIFRPQLTN